MNWGNSDSKHVCEFGANREVFLIWNTSGAILHSCVTVGLKFESFSFLLMKVLKSIALMAFD